MELGAFSVSLSVKDIHVSKDFYEKLGFAVFAGDIKQNWLIMKNGVCVIGLFQGMLDQNILTFNPGWNQEAGHVDPFTDIRQIQENWKAQGIKLTSEINAEASGPANFTLIDPDGNSILVDQHR